MPESIDVALAASIIEGLAETPLWSGFLERLRKATQSNFAALLFRPPHWRYEDSIHLLSADAPADVHELNRRHTPTLDLRQETMIEGRPYTLDEILGRTGGLERGPNAAFFRDLVVEQQITAVRQMRIDEPSGVSAWLTVSRRGPDFTRQETRLLSAIAPLLRGALRQHIAGERERYAAALTADAIRGLEFGWVSLDKAGNVIDQDELGARVLTDSGVLGVGATGRLTAKPPELERDIYQALNGVLESPSSRSRALTLSRDPWLDMLLVRARRKSIGTKSPPAVIAYVHGDNWGLTDRVEQLAELFGLSPSEARLALALSRGMTIAEAAGAFGLAVGTVRNSSKAIYAKTGARGLPDLVRIVMRSVLAIAPEA